MNQAHTEGRHWNVGDKQEEDGKSHF